MLVLFLFSFVLLLSWGHVVTFSKVLIICQIYRTWIRLLHHSPLSLLSPSWNSFIRCHFSIYIHVYTVFALYSLLHTLSSSPTLSLVSVSPDRTYSSFLFSDFAKENNDIFVCLRYLHREFPFHVYMYYNLNLFIYTLFLLCTLISYLWLFHQV
jgi:hypothetical protein